MFKIKNKNTRATSMTSSGAFIVNLTPLTYLTYLTPFSSVSIVDFEQVNASWNVTL